MTFCRFLEIFDQGAGISGTMGRSVPLQADCCGKVHLKKCCPKLYDLSLPSEAKGDILLQRSHDVLADGVRLFIIVFCRRNRFWVSFCYTREIKPLTVEVFEITF
ncbi:hypothetical protein CEXT_3491 [Caerostris extrusa]|uniref:Uncharacterized protein n=1 Tax=Caerostris extrusa TaxID=172846 RepID=A0AAV4QEP4_CAEEX|nr:hypothetical protein CEXT_3491 [Caerostris extrusa]